MLNMNLSLDQALYVEGENTVFFLKKQEDGSVLLTDTAGEPRQVLTSKGLASVNGVLMHLQRRCLGQYARIMIEPGRRRVYTVSVFDEVKTDDIFQAGGKHWVVAASLPDRVCLLGPVTEMGTLFAVVFKDVPAVQWAESMNAAIPKHGFMFHGDKFLFVAPRGARKVGDE